VASTIPNQAILINTLGLQEAKDSSAIENIITTHDELYRRRSYARPGWRDSEGSTAATGRR